jgi:hypothetical protein
MASVVLSKELRGADVATELQEVSTLTDILFLFTVISAWAYPGLKTSFDPKIADSVQPKKELRYIATDNLYPGSHLNLTPCTVF